jgi:hypothetical protein
MYLIRDGMKMRISGMSSWKRRKGRRLKENVSYLSFAKN